jgi:hypothetical protein
MSDSFLGESDDAREGNINIYENAQEGLDADRNPFNSFEGDDEEDD